MVVDCGAGGIGHGRFDGLPELLRAGDLLVFNDTRVIPARLIGRKDSGGRVEVLLERMLGEGGGAQEKGRVLAQLRASKAPRPGSELLFGMPRQDPHGRERSMQLTSPSLKWALRVRVVARRGEFFLLQFPAEPPLGEVLQTIGHTPLPPYIDRPDTAEDAARYQTVYAAKDGAVAAPTAGLHFDEALLQGIEQKGIDSTFVTLHVGAGTFQSLRVTEIESHRMHKEMMTLDEEVCRQVARCKADGGRVVAVGTTSARALETAALRAAGEGALQKDGLLVPYHGETDIFIYPGFRFRVVDALITNFHLPESTLLMLVSAFAGLDLIRRAYKEAVAEEYRFFSYGDAMLLHR